AAGSAASVGLGLANGKVSEVMGAGQSDIAGLVARARKGEARAVARLISLVEDAAPQLREAMAALAPYAGEAYVVGLTGSPRGGKWAPPPPLVPHPLQVGTAGGVA